MFGLITAHGVYRGDYLKKWLGEQLASHDVHTFADLPYSDGDRPPAGPARAFRLVVNVSDITSGCLRQLPWDYRDHYQLEPGPSRWWMRCAAILKDGESQKHWIVDGGMLSNFHCGHRSIT